RLGVISDTPRSVSPSVAGGQCKDQGASTYRPRIRLEQGRLDWSCYSAQALHRGGSCHRLTPCPFQRIPLPWSSRRFRVLAGCSRGIPVWSLAPKRHSATRRRSPPPDTRRSSQLRVCSTSWRRLEGPRLHL